MINPSSARLYVLLHTSASLVAVICIVVVWAFSLNDTVFGWCIGHACWLPRRRQQQEWVDVVHQDVLLAHVE